MRRTLFALAMQLAWAGSAHAQAADWTVKRAPFDATVAERYRAILAKNPWDDRALAELRHMYVRYRPHGEAELETIYRDATEPAAMVVYARLDPSDLDRWNHAVDANPSDARAHLALAALHHHAGRADLAEDQYTQALAAATDPATKRGALTGLIDLARAADDTNIDNLYEQLIALAPKDGKLWLERATALDRNGESQAAVDAFSRAEALFATDPSARLDAILGRARALAGTGDVAQATTQFLRVIDLAPAGYVVSRDAIDALLELYSGEHDRIVRVHELAPPAQPTLPELRDIVTKRWPVAKRTADQWRMIGRIESGIGEYYLAIEAYQHATRLLPTDIALQRELIDLFEATDDPRGMLQQLEIAARANPTDAQLAIDLATRHRQDGHMKSALAVLARLSQAARGNVAVHAALADVYTSWNHPSLALHERDEVVRIEPDPDRIVELGEKYWEGGQEERALATWNRLATTAEGTSRLAKVLISHDLLEQALPMLSRAIARAPKRADLWHLRAVIYAAMGRTADADHDAATSAELAKGMTLDAGHEFRHGAIRLLEDHDEDGSRRAHAHYLWQQAFDADPPDIEAGYMLAELLSVQPDNVDYIEILARLHELRPDDLDITRALVRSYKLAHKYVRAVALLQQLVDRDQAHAADYTEQIADLDRRIHRDTHEDQVAAVLAGEPIDPPPRAWNAAIEPIVDPEAEIRAAAVTADRDDPLAHSHAGFRVAAGTGLRGPADHTLLAGVYAQLHIGHRLAFIARLDWTQRTAQMDSVSAAALATGVALPVLDLRSAVIVAGLAHRTELRLGDPHDWDRLGLAGDVTLEVQPTHYATTLGLRFEQGISDHARSTALLLELGLQN